MLQKNLSKILRWHEIVPGFRVGMLPYIPFYWHKIRDRLMQHVQSSGEEWDNSASTFVLVQPLVEAVSIKGDDLPAWALVLADCLRDKSSDITQDWDVFRKYASTEAFTALWDAFSATRDSLPKASEVVQSGMPEPSDEDESEENPIPAGG